MNVYTVGVISTHIQELENVLNNEVAFIILHLIIVYHMVFYNNEHKYAQIKLDTDTTYQYTHIL